MAWLLESVPSAVAVAEEDGRATWELFVAGDAWFDRLLLRLGPDAEVVGPAEDRSRASRAAQRILTRYLGPAD